MVGYVYTSYGSRSLAAVESDINAYYSWYPQLDGIFLDEASTSCAEEPYYAALNSYVKSKGGIGLTVLNPGTQTNQCYEPAVDILLTFEGSDAQYVKSSLRAFMGNSVSSIAFLACDLRDLDGVGDGNGHSEASNVTPDMFTSPRQLSQTPMTYCPRGSTGPTS